MDRKIKEYLSLIGRKGGLVSRRSLSTQAAREMVKVREARRAFERFKSSCFWSYKPDLRIGISDVPWVVEQLMKHGNREAWEIASKLSR